MTPLHFDHSTLYSLVPRTGFYDNYSCPDQAMVYGVNAWHEYMDDWDPNNMYHNMWFVHNNNAQQLIDLIDDELKELIPEDHTRSPPVAMVATWKHPDTPYCLVGSFTNIGVFGIEQNALDCMEQIVGDLQHNDLEIVMHQMAYMENKHHFDACLLVQRLADPEGVAFKMQKRSRQREKFNTPIDEMTVLRYFHYLFKDEDIEVKRTISTMIERHDLEQSLDGTARKGARKKKM